METVDEDLAHREAEDGVHADGACADPGGTDDILLPQEVADREQGEPGQLLRGAKLICLV